MFRVTSFRQPVSSQSELRWPNLPSRAFSVQFSEDFANWQTVTNPALIFHSPFAAEWTDQDATNAHRFYRVQSHAD